MVFQFKIQITNVVKPAVWRRLTVPAGFTFAKFHRVIQVAFDWHDSHLSQFSPKGWGSSPVISSPGRAPVFMDDDDEEEKLDAGKIKLSDIFTAVGQTFVYTYDFGDDWQHRITLEKISDTNAKTADCLEGKGAAPPEDCGGFPGYEALKETLSNPKHPEHKEMKEWLGMEEDESWDANAFDLAQIQQRLKTIK